jgi:hypothetical protein
LEDDDDDVMEDSAGRSTGEFSLVATEESVTSSVEANGAEAVVISFAVQPWPLCDGDSTDISLLKTPPLVNDVVVLVVVVVGTSSGISSSSSWMVR